VIFWLDNTRGGADLRRDGGKKKSGRLGAALLNAKKRDGKVGINKHRRKT